MSLVSILIRASFLLQFGRANAKMKEPGGIKMIKYDRLWQTMKQRGVSQYDLYTHYNVNRSQLNRLRHNENVEINTIDKLCNILQCRVEDIMEHFPDDNRF